MKSFNKPQKLDDPTFVYGIVDKLMPEYKDIPSQYHMGSSHQSVKWQQKWFFSGLSDNEVPPAKEGIDKDEAMRHLFAIQRSFQPKHEHKVAAVAYLADKWFDFTKLEQEG